MNNSIAVIIPSYNGNQDIINCIDSLLNQDSGNYKIIVIDNASTDGSPERIKQKFRKVNLIKNNRNLGFAAACNSGLKTALKKNYWASILLNQDTVVEKNFIKESRKILSDKSVGLACPKIMFGFTNRVWWVGGKLITGLNLFTKPTFKVVENISKNSIDSVSFNKVYETDYITGCAMIIRMNAIKKVGYMDEKYFMYCEDVDLSTRFTKAGYKLVYFPTTKVHHMVKRGRKRPLKKKMMKAKNYLLSSARYVQMHFSFIDKLIWYFKLPFVLPLELTRSKNME